MPEFPEVETTLRGLASHVVGRRVASIRVYDPRLRWPVPADLSTNASSVAPSTGLDRRSKYLLFRVGGDTLLVHFGMTGSLRLPSPDPRRAGRTTTSTW